MSPLVSILVPAFNAQDWLSDTLQSALDQTWPEKEIIVVDDGSTDQTLAIARRFVSEGVQVITQKNQGAAAARNRALSLSRGDFIQWLDADDLLAPDKIHRQLERLNGSNSRTLATSSWGPFTYRPHRARFIPTPLWCDLTPEDWLIRKLGQNLSMQTATWLVSRELTNAAGPWDVRLLGDDDGEYFSRVVVASESIRFVPEARVYYRRGFSSLSYIGRSKEKLEAQFLSIKLTSGYVRSLEDSARTRIACLKFLETWLPLFYPERPDLISDLADLAADMGGTLTPPKLSWKYRWISSLLGWVAAKRVQVYYNQYKTLVIRTWDRVLFRLGQ